MSIFKPDEVESLEDFQNEDACDDWKSYEPSFEWTDEDLREFEEEKRQYEMEVLAMAAWWEMEGVRCATFDRNPNENPYLK